MLKISAVGHQCAKNTQIAAPQRVTNQASESQTSTSSRFMIGFCEMILVQPRTALRRRRRCTSVTPASESCYCAPMICVLTPKNRETEVAARSDAALIKGL